MSICNVLYSIFSVKPLLEPQELQYKFIQKLTRALFIYFFCGEHFFSNNYYSIRHQRPKGQAVASLIPPPFLPPIPFLRKCVLVLSAPNWSAAVCVCFSHARPAAAILGGRASGEIGRAAFCCRSRSRWINTCPEPVFGQRAPDTGRRLSSAR